MWWLWIVGYIVVGVGVGFAFARQEVKALIANPQKFRYEESTTHNYWEDRRKRELTEVERIQRCAESVFWESWWVGTLWPLCAGAAIVMGIYDLTTRIILGKELTTARKRDEAKKADKILKEYEREQREKFEKELE